MNWTSHPDFVFPGPVLAGTTSYTTPDYVMLQDLVESHACTEEVVPGRNESGPDFVVELMGGDGSHVVPGSS
jgi:hypothetical protein